MRILIVSYSFIPERSPRAHRTFELVREFSKRGFKVTLILPDYGNDNSYSFEGVDVIHVQSGVLFNRKAKIRGDYRQVSSFVNREKQSFLKKIAKAVFHQIFLGGKSFEYLIPVFFAVKQLKGVFDLGISIGLPMSSHFGLTLGTLFGGPKVITKVADYGDPFSYCSGSVLHIWVEKMLLRRFDYVTIPVVAAKEAFSGVVDTYKLKVIPQGFDLSSITTAPYVRNNPVTFAYAGVFYENIRNPISFFDFLSSLDFDFTFIVYTRFDHSFTMSFIKTYQNELKGKLVVLPAIDREELIFELSKMDFLLNFKNTNSFQSPSKLIDYKLSGRPVHNISCVDFQSDNFMRFMALESQLSDVKLDLDNYDIFHVANKFIQLSNRD